jgi:hypothetical protein
MGSASHTSPDPRRAKPPAYPSGLTRTSSSDSLAGDSLATSCQPNLIGHRCGAVCLLPVSTLVTKMNRSSYVLYVPAFRAIGFVGASR